MQVKTVKEVGALGSCAFHGRLMCGVVMLRFHTQGHTRPTLSVTTTKKNLTHTTHCYVRL
jgi:hypothetical protein